MASVYENSYMIVLIFLLLGILSPVVALTLEGCAPNKPSAEKATTYEVGEPFHDANIRFHARYYYFCFIVCASLM